MKKKKKDVEKQIAIIILNVFDVIDIDSSEARINAKKALKEFSDFWGAETPKAKRKDLKNCFKEFVTNEKGYLTTIPNLRAALL